MRRKALQDRALRGVVRGGGEVRTPPLACDDVDVGLDDRVANFDDDLGGNASELRETRGGPAVQPSQSCFTLSRRWLMSKGLVITLVIPRSLNSRVNWADAALTKMTGTWSFPSARTRS